MSYWVLGESHLAEVQVGVGVMLLVCSARIAGCSSSLYGVVTFCNRKRDLTSKLNDPYLSASVGVQQSEDFC